MESFKIRIGRVAPTAILALGISAGAWAILDLSNPSQRRCNGNPATRSDLSLFQRTDKCADHECFPLSNDDNTRTESRFIHQVDYTYQPPAVDTDNRLAETDSVAQEDSSDPTRKTAADDSLLNKGPSVPPSHQEGIMPRLGSILPPLIPKPAIINDTISILPNHSHGHTTADRTDSSRTRTDSISIDSMKLSAWLPGIRHTQPQARIFPEYQYPLFLYSNVMQQSATFDSTGTLVDVRETLFGKDIRIPIQVPATHFIRLEQNYLVQKAWEDLAHTYTASTQQGGLNSLMQSMTNIDIPIPSNPVLSIFGPPRINLNISGAIDIHGAWQNQKTNAQTVSTLGNVTNQPDFKQDVQINVGGTVGDKLNIGANWDTQNQFDYENQLKLKYTGYDDEIIQSVEAGNVSMASNSSFIGSSQALFGIKAQAQFGPFTLTGLASQQKAQSKTLTVSGGSSNQPFTLRAYGYSQNHFFIDTTYRPIYEKYLQSNAVATVNPNKTVSQIQVWEFNQTATPNPNARFGVAVMDLPVWTQISQSNGYYDSLSTLTKIDEQPGLIETGNFVLLTTDQYSLDVNNGVLTLNSTPQAQSVVAVAYETQDGTTYGTLTSNVNSAQKQNLVLKLVKAGNPIPPEKGPGTWS